MSSDNGKPWYEGKTILFTCSRCGKCCRRKGMVYFSQEDIRNAAQYLEMSIEDFDKKYIFHQKETAFVFINGRKSPCPFHNEDNTCRIQDAKPEQCRMYPFWPNIIGTEQAWTTERIFCRGIGKGKTVDIAEMAKMKLPDINNPEQEAIMRGLVSCSFNYRPESDGKCRSEYCIFSSVRGDKIKAEGCMMYKIVQEMEKDSKKGGVNALDHKI